MGLRNLTQDTIPQSTILQDTILKSTIPQSTISQSTIPQSTIRAAFKLKRESSIKTSRMGGFYSHSVVFSILLYFFFALYCSFSIFYVLLLVFYFTLRLLVFLRDCIFYMFAYAGFFNSKSLCNTLSLVNAFVKQKAQFWRYSPRKLLCQTTANAPLCAC